MFKMKIDEPKVNPSTKPSMDGNNKIVEMVPPIIQSDAKNMSIFLNVGSTNKDE